MKASELRIGNLVYAPALKGVRTIDCLDIRDLFEGRLYQPFEPIALTPEWLERFGAFRERGNAWWIIPTPDYRDLGTTSIMKFSQGCLFIEQVLHQGFTQSVAAEIITQHEAKHGKIEDDDSFGMCMRKNSIQIEYDIKYVHTFQNLWFALTGEELTLKEGGKE